MKKSLVLLLIVCYTATFLTGCATVFSNSEYDVQIVSDRSGDKVILKQGYKTIANKTTPYTMRLRASRDFFQGESYTLEYVNPSNGQREEALYNARMDPWVIGSIIFTGCLGLLVDGASGAMYKLPDQFYICTDNPSFTINDAVPTQPAVPETKNLPVAKETELKISPDSDEDNYSRTDEYAKN